LLSRICELSYLLVCILLSHSVSVFSAMFVDGHYLAPPVKDWTDCFVHVPLLVHSDYGEAARVFLSSVSNTISMLVPFCLLINVSWNCCSQMFFEWQNELEIFVFKYEKNYLCNYVTELQHMKYSVLHLCMLLQLISFCVYVCTHILVTIRWAHKRVCSVVIWHNCQSIYYIIYMHHFYC